MIVCLKKSVFLIKLPGDKPPALGGSLFSHRLLYSMGGLFYQYSWNIAGMRVPWVFLNTPLALSADI